MDFKLLGFETKNPKEDQKQICSIDLGNGSDILYMSRFLSPQQSWDWFRYLDKEIPWTRPSIHVFGRSCTQPRDTCYIASEGLPEYKYSGYQPTAYSWNDYPPLKLILEAVHEALPGSRFNSLLLNRYKSGSDHVSWHSDDEKLYGPTPEIASVSFGCEREFLLRKKTGKRFQELLEQNQEKKGKSRHTFMLKHGSLLVMRGYTQRDWSHCVPKRAKVGGLRINLTFRYMPTLPH